VADDAPADDRDLPLVEVPAGGPGSAPADTFAVILTGDGGWASIDRQIGETLASRGTPVVGWNSLKYYWTKRTPEEAASDLAWILGRYARAFGRSRAVLIGYSFGADVLPFLVNRLPEASRARLASVVLLGPSHEADFEFHVSGWLGGEGHDSLPTLPEASRLVALPVLCLFGSEEHDSLCRDLAAANVTRQELSGGHHLGGDYDGLADRIQATMTPK
jgi:type IV secretory pathway VirJ component